MIKLLSSYFNIQSAKVSNSNLKESKNLSWKVIGRVETAGNSVAINKYSFTDKKLNSGTCKYRLKMVDNDGTFKISKTLTEKIAVPKSFSISQNYPNPFNPSTKINFRIPVKSKVKVEIYDILGRKILEPFNKIANEGFYSLEINLSRRGFASGVYLYKIIAVGINKGNQFVKTKKMVFLK